MKKNNNILKLLTVAFMAIGSVSQVYGMDFGGGGGGEGGPTGGPAAAGEYSPPARSRVCSRDGSVGSTASFMGMSGEAYFARKHGEALVDVAGNRLARRVCDDLFGAGDTPWDGAPTVEGILEGLSAETGSGDAKPTLEDLVRHRQCVDTVVLEMVNRLNTIRDPNDPRAVWVVCRAATLLLSDRRITSGRWLTRIRADDDQDVVGYLISDGGVVVSVLDALTGEFAKERNPDLRRFISDRGTTNVFELSNMFCGAAAVFPAGLLNTRVIERRRHVSIPFSMADIFDESFSRADFLAHVPDGRTDLVSLLRSTLTAAALSARECDDARRDRDGARGDLQTARQERDGARGDLQTARQERDGARGDLQTVTQERDGLTGQLAAAIRERDAARAAAASWWSSLRWLAGGAAVGVVACFGINKLKS